jgi:hypothetical protein
MDLFFNGLRSRTLTLLRAFAECFFMLLLVTRQEVTKKTDFGKPKSQVCLFAKREHRASHGRKHCEPRRSLLELPRHCRSSKQAGENIFRLAPKRGEFYSPAKHGRCAGAQT